MTLCDRIKDRQIIALLTALTLLCLFIWGGEQPVAVGLFPAPWDKLAHFAWFVVLSGLLCFSLRVRDLIWVVLFCMGVAIWDEWRQLTLPGRSADLGDLLFDGLGIIVGLVICRGSLQH
jgi:VanZ family protein